MQVEQEKQKAINTHTHDLKEEKEASKKKSKLEVEGAYIERGRARDDKTGRDGGLVYGDFVMGRKGPC